MTIQLIIPDSIVEALRLPRGDRGRELQVELAVALYARGKLLVAPGPLRRELRPRRQHHRVLRMRLVPARDDLGQRGAGVLAVEERAAELRQRGHPEPQRALHAERRPDVAVQAPTCRGLHDPGAAPPMARYHDPETNVTNDDELLTAKIALAHLREFADCYTRLRQLEDEAEVREPSRPGRHSSLCAPCAPLRIATKTSSTSSA